MYTMFFRFLRRKELDTTPKYVILPLLSGYGPEKMNFHLSFFLNDTLMFNFKGELIIFDKILRER